MQEFVKQAQRVTTLKNQLLQLPESPKDPSHGTLQSHDMRMSPQGTGQKRRRQEGDGEAEDLQGMESRHAQEGHKKHGERLDIGSMLDGKRISVSVLANQEAALRWNANSKLCMLASLLGHFDPTKRCCNASLHPTS